MASSHHSTHPRQVSVRLAPPLCYVLFRSSYLFEHTLTPSVHYPPSISLAVNIMYIQTFCGHLHVLYIFDPTYSYRFEVGFEVRLELKRANAHLIVSPPSLSPSHPPKPSPSRWPALTTLLPLAKLQLVWRRLCETLLSSSSLAGQKHPSLLSGLV